MRYLFVFLALLMGLFVAVQYNDPDGPLWMLFYGIPAVAAATAAGWPRLLKLPMAQLLLAVATFAALGLTTALWPTATGWWRMSVWWEDEAAREGMGLMLASAVLISVLAASLTRRGRQRDTAAGHEESNLRTAPPAQRR